PSHTRADLPSFPTRRSSDLQDRGAETREPCQVRGDLCGIDLPRVVTHDAETVVQRHFGAVYALQSLQGEPRGRGTASARHLGDIDRKSTRLNSSHQINSYAV